MPTTNASYWSSPPDELLQQLDASEQGLSDASVRARRTRFGPNVLRPRRRASNLVLLLAQFKSPIVLLLLFAAGLAAALGEHADALIILVIVLGSGLLGFWQERGAAGAVEALLARVRVKTTLRRDGVEVDVPLEDVVPGDIVILSAGDVIPADSRLLTARDLYVDEASLTGETYPVEKTPTTVPPEATLSHRTNSLFLGTHVVSGTGVAVVVRTGGETEFSQVTQHMSLGRTETEFEHGVRHFGYFLMEVTLVLVIAIFAINVYLAHPVIDSFLFSLALAVGLTPQLLPAIISINLAHGARRMADRKVIVKRLASIENFGSMDVLCSDKTGTLTEGVVRVHSAEDFEGAPSAKAQLYAFLNAHFETGFTNPIDDAIRADRSIDVVRFEKAGEVPYDFIRKRLSVLVATEGQRLLVTKGAVPNVLAACTRAETAAGHVLPLGEAKERIERRFAELGAQGYRVLGVAHREFGDGPLTPRDETEMTFAGFLVLHDPLKKEIVDTVARLSALGVSLKIITGDNRYAAETVGRLVGLDVHNLLNGPDIHLMSDEALVRSVGETSVFAEVEPNQKERLLLALKKAGKVVGYLGDGINDATALHAADVGLSVDTAVDVAKEAADIVLLEKDLGVLAEGVCEGRRTFANTLKYVYIATSANFGNMFSMAGASLFLSYLPLLPKQVLLLNLLTDLPEMAIATDRVDEELVARPRRWDIRSIRRFMIVFGTISSVFDYATFVLLLLVLRVTPATFRTAWFLESLVSACLIVLVIRTRKPFFASRPGRALGLSTLVVVTATLVLPYTAIGTLMGFTPIPAWLLLALGLIVVFYVGAAEVIKRRYDWQRL
ncbi:MAG: magnesium-translocating P-type ATPase [Isosphaeraceae bacterium]|nr:magnesium-translocating P-type ATPase [Isosphaeraceae bacterium]